MKVVITGGAGFLGLRLARRLLARGELTAADGGTASIDSLVLADATSPPEQPAWADARVEFVRCDIGDHDAVAELIDRDDLAVFHLASIVSAQAEEDLGLALRVNIDGGRNVLDAVGRLSGRQRVVVTSTYAAFGGELPEVCGDGTKLTPQSTYGMTKVVLELLVNDYTRRGLVDGRVARLPTVIIRPGAANAAASSVASAVFREPLKGLAYEVPISLDTRMAVTGARTVVEGLIALHEADGTSLGLDRAVSFPSASYSIAEMIESLRRVAGDRPLGAIDVKEEPRIQAMVSTWPSVVDSSRAREIGIPPTDELEQIVRAYVEEFVDA